MLLSELSESLRAWPRSNLHIWWSRIIYEQASELIRSRAISQLANLFRRGAKVHRPRITVATWTLPLATTLPLWPVHSPDMLPLVYSVIKIREQTLAEDHRSRLAPQHALTGAYQANGQVKVVVSLLLLYIIWKNIAAVAAAAAAATTTHQLSYIYFMCNKFTKKCLWWLLLYFIGKSSYMGKTSDACLYSIEVQCGGRESSNIKTNTLVS